MDLIRMITAVTLALALACCGGASSGQSGGKKEKMVGGCRIDTVALGLYIERAPGGPVPDRLTVRSTRDAGHETMRSAAIELTSLLDSLGMRIAGRSELLHVVKGACWPRYSIVIEIDPLAGDRAERVRQALAAGTLAGLRASPERGDDYGTFFVTAGRGSSDWWTLWYRE